MRLRVNRTIQIASTVIALGATVLILRLTQNVAVSPTVANIGPEAKISFTFDDGLTTSLTRAAPILQKYGFRATDYVISGCVGTSGICPANVKTSYMSWDQIHELQQKYNWEIGSHTVNHPPLGQLSLAKQDHELSKSKSDLAEHGINATSFASPYGDYSNQTLALTAKYYQSHRGFWDQGYNRWPYNEYLLAVQQIQSNVTVGQLKSFVDEAIRDKRWLILTFHNIKDNPSSYVNDFEYSAAQLDEIAAYVKMRNLPVTTISESLANSNVNLLSNGSFEQGLSGGWSTDTPENVTLDTNSNGCYPSPKNSILLTSGTTATHLFSPQLSLDSSTTYMLKSFLNVTTITNGQIGYYVDEFDADGKWVSGQWRMSENSAFAENMNFTYKPTSAKVKRARLQVFVTAGSDARAYIDNFQWFPMKQQ